MWTWIGIGSVVIVLILIIIYRWRMKLVFEREFNQTAFQFLTLGQQMNDNPDLQPRYIQLHNQLDVIYSQKPAKGLALLNNITQELNQLKKDIKKSSN